MKTLKELRNEFYNLIKDEVGTYDKKVREKLKDILKEYEKTINNNNGQKDIMINCQIEEIKRLKNELKDLKQKSWLAGQNKSNFNARQSNGQKPYVHPYQEED